MPFTARQTIRTERCEFAWRAKVAPFGLIHVEDSIVDGTPVGRVSLAGLLNLQSAAVSIELRRAQLMRYMAELPWCPDAIWSNHALIWIVEDNGDLSVQAQSGPARAEMRFALDAQGLPIMVSGSRPAMENGGYIERQWTGAFSDYRRVCGRLVPHSAKVGWVIDGSVVYVWEGRLTNWVAN